MMRGWATPVTLPIAIFLIVFVLGAALLVLAVRPFGLVQVVSHADPVASYAEAVQRVAALQAQERDGYNPVCQTQLLTHGAKTARAVVLVHGYGSCPQQLVPLGRQFFERGDNVLIVRLPRHGLADRLTLEHGNLLASELAGCADEAVDIAAGLGERVLMLGQSGGAMATAWAAQTRAELDQAIIIAPAFGYRQLPAPVTVLLMNLALLLLPNIALWGDPRLREPSAPPYDNPRYTTRAAMQILRLGFAIRAAARRGPPAARSIVVVTNGNDDTVDNAAARRLVADWHTVGAAKLSHYEFPAALGLEHDLLDPAQPYARTEQVYPKLMELADL